MKLSFLFTLPTLLFALLFVACSEKMAQSEPAALEAPNPAGVSIGDKAPNFRLKSVDGSIVSLNDYDDQEGLVVIFTCNHCPYAKAYEDRIIALHRKYASQGYPVVAINPNDPDVQREDSYALMQERAREKGFPYQYVMDRTQTIFRAYGATRTPHVFLLDKERRVRYIGAIDDNYADADKVEEHYLENAIKALQMGKAVKPDVTKAVGCTIKVKA